MHLTSRALGLHHEMFMFPSPSSLSSRGRGWWNDRNQCGHLALGESNGEGRVKMLSPVDGLWKIVSFLGENGRECYRPGEPKNKDRNDRTTGRCWRGKGEEMGGIGRNLVTKGLARYFVLLAMRHAFEGF